jgi:hypothetical protein
MKIAILLIVIACLLPACGEGPATPGPLVTAINVPGGTTGSEGYPCQSFELPLGQRLNGLRINFYRQGNVPSASGTLYLLTQPFKGTPQQLTSQTFGYLSHTARIENSQFVFHEQVTLTGGRTYWIYAATQQPFMFYFQTDQYEGGAMCAASHGSQPYIERLDQDMSFRVEGTAITK